MNIKEKPVENAANLSLFMVNLSHILAKQTQEVPNSMLDLKARCQALFYLEQLLKINPNIQEVISLETLKNSFTHIGAIHSTKKEGYLNEGNLEKPPNSHKKMRKN